MTRSFVVKLAILATGKTVLFNFFAHLPPPFFIETDEGFLAFISVSFST
jgi:hypothetical protein